MKITVLTPALNLLVAPLLSYAARTTLQSHEDEHVLNTSEKILPSYTKPNVLKEIKKLASTTLASEATGIPTEKQSFGKHERDHFKTYRAVTKRSQGSLFNRNKFLHNRNRPDLNGTNSRVFYARYLKTVIAETDWGSSDKSPSNVFHSVSNNRTQNSTNTLNKTTHSIFTAPSTKPTTKVEHGKVPLYRLATTKALHKQILCESSWLSCRGRCMKGQDLGCIFSVTVMNTARNSLTVALTTDTILRTFLITDILQGVQLDVPKFPTPQPAYGDVFLLR